MQATLGDAQTQYAGTEHEAEFDSRSLDILKDFGRHVCQDLIDTMEDMIKNKCQELARAVKKGQFDDWCAHASQDIWEMKRVIREASVLHGDMSDCLGNWLEQRENKTPNAEVTGRPLADGPVDRRVRRQTDGVE